MPADFQVGTMEIDLKHSYLFQVDALAYRHVTDDPQLGHRNNIMVMSFGGGGTAVKAAIAALQCGKSALPVFRPKSGMGNDFSGHLNLRNYPGGYVIKKQALGFNTFHAVAIAKDERLMLDLTEEALWKVLRTTDYTTPILRHWMTWTLSAMLLRVSEDREGHLVEKLKCFQLNAGIVTATPEELDAVVRDGIRSGKLTFVGARS
jgi:hypothetical protein